MKPRLLDLFCKAGGCSEGYTHAGFVCYGVDIEPQRNYRHPFIQANAIEIMQRLLVGEGITFNNGETLYLRDFAVVHASPPCQRFSVMKLQPQKKEHPDLIAPIRSLLKDSGLPYIIENVPGSPLVEPITLCGSMFGLHSDRGYLRRHRLFETNWPCLLTPSCNHNGLAIGVYGHGSAGWLGQRMRTAKVAEARVLMDMDWMTRDELSQAIPWAYTHFIGKQLMAVLS